MIVMGSDTEAPRPPTTCTPKSSRSWASSEIDLAGRTPQLLTRDLAEPADVVVTMGCGDSCPYIPGKR
jgi:arsenate reductase